jgi:hypothetical protein
MKTNLKRAAVMLLVFAGLAALTGSKAFKLHAKPPACTTAILQGGYGAGTTGLINTSGNPNDIRIRTFAPFAEAAYFIFDGHGNLSGSSTVDFAGFISPVTFTGTYTVNANCTGNLTVDAGASGIVHRDLVIVDAGKEVEFVSTDRGVVIAGHMKKQRVGGE